MWLSSFLTLLCILGGFSIAHFDLRQLADSESAIANLEDVLKSEEQIREFCYKHYECKPKSCNGESTGNSTSKVYNNCVEIRDDGYKTSGIYEIQIDTGMELKKMSVYCDMEADEGGWLVIQRRGKFNEEHVDFIGPGSEEYNIGFGNLSTEFWLGNENIHLLTTLDEVALRVDLEDFEGNTRYAEYLLFQLGDSDTSYMLKIGNYYGNAGDGMSIQDGISCDYNRYVGHIYTGASAIWQGGWWWGNTTVYPSSFLNGEYLKGEYTGFPIGIWWNPWRGKFYSLKRTEMKIKPIRYLSAVDVATTIDNNHATDESAPTSTESTIAWT